MPAKNIFGPMAIAEKIVALRSAHDMSQGELAKKAKLTQTTLSRIESGKVTPNTSTLTKIARVFGVSIEALLDKEANEEALLPFGGKAKDNVTTIRADQRTLLDVADRIKAKNFIKNLTAYLVLHPEAIVAAVSVFEEVERPALNLLKNAHLSKKPSDDQES
jgi:transcriptional regulator with XRE-family HTH domain